ncbi:MAG: hypothetical protein U9Q40_11075 [Campylobacterota bacterium]|nr:hypothetical protein [Campylobacterota bacterium]
MTFEQQWIEYDYNPFVLFDINGKITSLNSEAQFLLGSTTPNELFDLAKAYANVSFGFKTTFVDLEFGRYKFFGVTVGYEDEEQIGIKLYQTPSFKIKTPKPDGQLTNVFTLIDLCISTNSISSDIKYTKEYDPTIPDIIINSNKLIKILNKIYSCFEDNEAIHTTVFYRIGEHIRFDEKKYSLFSIRVSADNLNDTRAKELKIMSEDNNFYIDVKKDLTINIPMITS